MDSIYHEKQVGQLCGLHCLNNLLQGEYFSEIDLATIAKRMDEEEKQRMAEGGTNSDEYQQFLTAPSANMDDSGFFSVQVIANALSVWNLEAISFTSKNPVALQAQSDPTTQKAYICNYKEHWFTIRKIGRQWFNLNSVLSGPELVSTTYLALFLKQLQQEGYSIFVIVGQLPDSLGDQTLANTLVSQARKPHLLNQSSKPDMMEGLDANERNDLEAALKASMADDQEDQQSLQMAIAMSMSDYDSKPGPSGLSSRAQPIADEDDDLQKALRMSLEQFDN